MKITIKDIARIAGVSHTTVVKALQNKPRISGELREKILAIARENYYIPNVNARNLASHINRTIGLIITGLGFSIFEDIATILGKIAKENGFDLVIASSGNDPDAEEQAVLDLMKMRVAGIIIAPSYIRWDFLDIVRHAALPCVLLGRYDNNTDYLAFDDVGSTEKATRHLLGLGHRNILCVSPGEICYQPFSDWYAGCRKAIEESGLSSVQASLELCGGNPDEGYRLACRIARMEPRPSGVISFNGAISPGLMKGFVDAGLGIPQDISLISLEDEALFKYLSPPLTAVSFPTKALAHDSAMILMKRIRGEHGMDCNISETELILRGSTAQVTR